MDININCKISHESDILEELHNKYHWIPGKDNIRPLPKIMEKKQKELENILFFYHTLKDYILEEIFNTKTNFVDNKLLAMEDNFESFRMVLNKYPYDLPNDTYHYILWYKNFNSKTDQEITNDIVLECNRIFKTKPSFVWYKNPKMSIPGIFHVQVFLLNKN
ncbi:hypothetical protein CPAV1605_303 [seawater metagenome]|uniref:Uncharacterized protein n=1 Tax=seawater metagenome TaxID=1561972 RepID=A0A5E8CGN1_9ZZZZ